MPLWNILLKAQARSSVPLTYDECLVILNYLMLAIDDAGWESTWQALHRHQARCRACFEHEHHRLRQLESGLAINQIDRQE
jgi:hypothetical protein